MVREYKRTMFFKNLPEMRAKCTLCPHFCILKEHQTGLCGVRQNFNGDVYSSNYGYISGVHLDPIEKKTLYHFHPGKAILSVGSLGCNLFCKFCQNWEIAHPEKSLWVRREYSPEELTIEAKKQPYNIGIAYTYNEPIVFYEFMYDTARIASEENLKNVMVSNGFINPTPLEKLLPYMDAFNIDLKAFDDEFYKKQTKSNLQPVLETLKLISLANKHLEITNLVIPGLNDNEAKFREMMEWISRHLKTNTVLHLSRYFPQYKIKIPPTSVDTLKKLYNIAKEYLPYVYIGNVMLKDESTTYCPKCNTKLIERNGYQISISKLTENGNCENCGEKIVIF